MKNTEEHLSTLNDIRNMMNRSSRFISLSGLSGIFAGIAALAGAYLAHIELSNYSTENTNFDAQVAIEANLIKIGIGVLIFALIGGFVLTFRQTKRRNLPFWDKTAKNMLINLAIPLIAGGFFILALLFNTANYYGLIAPTCLVFYGLALINASKYTYSDIRFLGLCEVTLGIFSMFYVSYGLYFWAMGFGILHIIYGTIMYIKYERV